MPCAQRRALADEAGEGRGLQAGDQRLVDIDAVPAARMQLERGLAILGDGDAGEAAGLVERLAAQHRGRAAEEGGVPLVEAALDDAVEHLVLGRHLLEGAQVALDRIGIEEEVRRLHEEELRIVVEVADRLPQEVARRRVVGVEHDDEFAGRMLQGRC